MTSEQLGRDIIENYKQTANKLKKRFLRKPNVSEAAESYTVLGHRCENLEMPSYAGLCWNAAARCEGSLGNNVGETTCLLRSARQFLKAEEDEFNLGCFSPNSENLHAGLGGLAHVCETLPENTSFIIGINLEIIDFLKKINRHELIEEYLFEANELSENMVDTKLHILGMLALNFIDKCDYLAALQTYSEITDILEKLPKNGTRIELLLESEISSVFLLLILRPTPQKLAPNPKFAKLLEKYTWEDSSEESSESPKMSEDLLILMQSLVTVCQSLDTSSLINLELKFWKFINTQQKDLLRILVRIHCPT